MAQAFVTALMRCSFLIDLYPPEFIVIFTILNGSKLLWNSMNTIPPNQNETTLRLFN